MRAKSSGARTTPNSELGSTFQKKGFLHDNMGFDTIFYLKS